MTPTAPVTAPPPPKAGLRPHRLRWLVLVVVMTANVMDAMDSTIANIAGPSVRHDLGGGGVMVVVLIGAPGSRIRSDSA